MSKVKIIAFAGLPFTGKSTLAKLLEEKLEITRLDVDEVRRLLFKYNEVDTEKERELDELQMRASWKSLQSLTDNVVEAKQSVIVAGTFSRKIQHQWLIEISENRNAALMVVFCHVADEVIEKRVNLREEENSSHLRKIEGYYRVKARYEKILTPNNILEIDTSRAIEECLEEIIQFINN